MENLVETIIKIIDVCEEKIPSGIEKLKELNIDDPNFAVVLSNTEKCLTLSQGYKNLLIRNMKSEETKEDKGE